VEHSCNNHGLARTRRNRYDRALPRGEGEQGSEARAKQAHLETKREEDALGRDGAMGLFLEVSPPAI
jgi:hypothetical protein